MTAANAGPNGPAFMRDACPDCIAGHKKGSTS
jgi:hypothetical protein